MSTVSVQLDVAPEQVWPVLADGWSYANWVVGASHIRAVDEGWPAEGTRIHHAFGSWPLLIRDTTHSTGATEPTRLSMVARGWPTGEATIVLTLVPHDGGTTLTMVEEPRSGPGKWLHNPLSEAVLTRRNQEALARFKALVEGRSRAA